VACSLLLCPRSRLEVRSVETGGVWIACGGTHVKALGEIGGVVVTKIKKVKASVRFSYKMV